MQLRRIVLDYIDGKHRSPFVGAILSGCAQAFRWGVALRNKAYDHRLLPVRRLEAMVISVGNIAAGGTGKTPCVQLLAQALSPHLATAILSRGFKSQREKTHSEQPISPYAEAAPFEYGDEPVLLAQKTQLPVWVGQDRIKSGQAAVRHGIQCLILDDGMQHRRLHRDIDIVVVDGKDPFAKGAFLPRGLLRDSPHSLKRATLIVATHVENASHYEALQHVLAPYSSAPIVAVQVQVLSSHDPHQKVGVFCGLGRPERFFQTLKELPQDIVETLVCEDHVAPTPQQLRALAQTSFSRGAKTLLCTEKDFVKIPPSLREELSIVPVVIGLRITEGEEQWQQLIKTILQKRHL